MYYICVILFWQISYRAAAQRPRKRWLQIYLLSAHIYKTTTIIIEGKNAKVPKYNSAQSFRKTINAALPKNNGSFVLKYFKNK